MALTESFKKRQPASGGAMPADGGFRCRNHTPLSIIDGSAGYQTVPSGFSSTRAINRYLSNQDLSIRTYLDRFSRHHDLATVDAVLDGMADLDVLIVGDTIIDEYQFCQSIGKSSKDPTLAIKYESSDVFAGGAVAIANHLARLAASVQLVTVIGEHDSRRTFIENSLHPNVRPTFFVQKGAPTLIKRRFVDSYTLNKLFEVYIMDDAGLDPATDRQMGRALKSATARSDLVIAADFGHGAISTAIIDQLTGSAPYLAVNTQANAGNRGFHTISKYGRANYVSIAEHELRLEMRDEKQPVDQLARRLFSRLEAEKITITRGRKGCLVLDRDGVVTEAPALARNVVDRVGSGDALLAVTALAARLKTANPVIAFLGNVVGALAVEMLGNEKAIDKNSIKQYAGSLFERY